MQAEDDDVIRWSPPRILEDPHALANPHVPALIAYWRRVREVIADVDPELDERIEERSRKAVGLGDDVSLQLDLELSVPMLQRLHVLATREQTAARAIAADGSFRYVPFPYGKLKDKPNSLSVEGRLLQEFCSPDQTVPQLERLIALHAKLPEALPEVRTAFVVAGFCRIHPFADGNGRTARLLANWDLRRAGLPSLWGETSDRGTGWMDAIYIASKTHDLVPLIRLFRDNLDRAVTRLVLEAEDPPRDVDLDGMSAFIERQRALAATFGMPAPDVAALAPLVAERLTALADRLPGVTVKVDVDVAPNGLELARVARRVGLTTPRRAAGMRVVATFTRDGADARLTVCAVPLGTLNTGAVTLFAKARPRGPVATGFPVLNLFPTETDSSRAVRLENWLASVQVAGLGILHRLA